MIRTDILLDPVSFVTRMESPMWDSLTPRDVIVAAVNRGLSADAVQDIREAYRDGVSIAQIARCHGILWHTAYRIVKRQTYRNIPDRKAA